VLHVLVGPHNVDVTFYFVDFGVHIPFTAIVTTTKLKADVYRSVLVPRTSPLMRFVGLRAVSVMSNTTFFLDVLPRNVVDT
jgi:hypothetical protein